MEQINLVKQRINSTSTQCEKKPLLCLNIKHWLYILITYENILIVQDNKT